MKSAYRVLTGLFLGAAMALPSQAQISTPSTPETLGAPQAQRYATGTFLAFVRTGQNSLDHAAEKGLLNLAVELSQRSTIELDGVAAIDLEQDDLSFFPKLYWQIHPNTKPLSRKGQENLQKFLETKRLLVIDIQSTPGQKIDLRRVLGDVQIQQPMHVLDKDHSLTYSFYMLDGLPGTHNDSYVLRNGTKGQPTTVIIGQNKNWAQAWAGISIPPGTAQDDPPSAYEMSLRAGINMVLSALGGTLKDDAAHQETIQIKRAQRDKEKGPQ
jgi:hypothetical protein